MTTSPAAAPAWLSHDEMRGWRAFAEVNHYLMAALEADLAPHGLSFGDYEVLVNLSEADRTRLRMCDLADRLGLSPSGLTRRLNGLVKAGYVARQPSRDDGRVTLATLTAAGLAAMRNASADHLASVRRHLLDHLDGEQIKVLGDIFIAVGRALGRTTSIA